MFRTTSCCIFSANLLALLVLCALLPSICLPATIRVPDDYATILLAMAAAESGDVISARSRSSQRSLVFGQGGNLDFGPEAHIFNVAGHAEACEQSKAPAQLPLARHPRPQAA